MTHPRWVISIVFICSFEHTSSFLSFCRSIIPPGFLSCKGMAVLSDTKHHVVIGEETFPQPSAIRDCGIPEKFLDRLFGFLPFLTAMLFRHEKRLGVKVMPEC